MLLLSKCCKSSRSPSVLVTLLRLRNEFQRLGGNAATVTRLSMPAAQSKPTSVGEKSIKRASTVGVSVPEVTQAPEGTSISSHASFLSSSRPNNLDLQRLMTDALRLLNKRTRSSDSLSDLVVSSPQYYMEVGKLLTVASSFRASTADARVAEALDWVRQHLSQFQTTRQIISVCMPITNLKDGQSNGQEFIWDYLYEPLLMSLQQGNVSDVSSFVAEATSSALPSSSGDLNRGEADEDRQLQQNRTAVVSVFSLISKFLVAPRHGPLAGPVLTTVGSSPDETAGEEKVTPSSMPHKPCKSDETDKLLTLLEAAVMNLERSLYSPSRGGGTGEEIGQEGVAPAAHSRRLPTSVSSLRLSECTHYLQGSHAMRQLLRSLDAGPQGAVSRLARLDACDRVMWPIVGSSIAFATSNDSSTAGVRSLKAYDIINLLKILTQLDSAHLEMDQPIQLLLAFLPVVVSMSTMGEVCALVQVLSKACGRDSAIAALPSRIVLPLFESIRTKLFMMVESHGAQICPMECSILLSGLSRLESSSESNDGVDWGSRASMEDVYIATDMLNLLCVHFIAGAEHVGAAQLLPFLQGLARLKATLSRRRGRKSVAKADTDILTEHLPVLSTTLVKCADIATRLARHDKLSALEAAHILALLVRLRFKGCDTFFLSIEKLLTSVFSDDLLGGSGDNHRGIHAVVFDAVDRLIGVLSDPTMQMKEKSNTERPHSHALSCALELRSRLYNSVLGSMTQAETPKEVIRLLRLLYPSLSTPTTPVRGEIDIHHASSSTITKTIRQLDYEGAKLLADGEADDEVVVHMKDLLKGGDEGAARILTDADAELDMPYEAHHAKHTMNDSLEAFARRIEYVSSECNSHEVVELSMAIAQLYRYQGLGGAIAYRALDHLLHHSSVVSLSVAQYKKLLDALRIAKRGDTVPLHILKGFSSALAAGTAGNSHEKGNCSTEGGCLATSTPLSILEAIAVGRTILTSIKQQLNSAHSIANESNHATEQQRNERANFFLEICVSYISQCTMAFNRFNLNSYPDHLSGSAEELIVLAYVLAQLYRIISTGHARSVELPHKSAIAHEAVDYDVPGYDDGDLRLDLVEERDGIDDRNYTGNKNTKMNEEQFFTFQSGIVALFNALGDALCPFLEQLQLPSTEDDKGFEGSLWKEGHPSSHYPSAATSGTHTIEPKKYVMLIQSFGIVGVVHHNLLYSILPQIQRLAPCIDPLELSLLMNYLARSGVCSRRILDCLATEIGRHVAKSELRQCYAILRSMQRSGFLSKRAFLWPKRALVLNADQDTDTLAISRNAKLKSSLDVLARAVVERLDSLIAQESQILDVMHSYSLGDLVGVVHALDFFDAPPQPTFDSYYIISAKKLLFETAQFSEQNQAELGAKGIDEGNAVERILLSAVLLASCTHLLRRSDHQAVSSSVIAFSLSALDRCRCLGSNIVVPIKRGIKSTTRLRAGGTAFAASVAKLSDEKLIELIQSSRLHWLLYDVKLLPSEFFIIDMLLRRLEARRRDEESDSNLSGSFSHVHNMVKQLARCNVFIPFQGMTLRSVWRLAHFVDHHVLCPLSQTCIDANGVRLTPKEIVTLSCVQNYLACGSSCHNNFRKRRGPGGDKTPLAELLLPGLRKALSYSTSLSKSSGYHGSHEESTHVADLKGMGLSDIASLYLTRAILLSRLDAPGNEFNAVLKGETDLFTSTATVLISKLEQQFSKISARSCVDLVLGSCLLLNIELSRGSIHTKGILSSGSNAVSAVVRRVLVEASQVLTLKLHQSSHTKNRWFLLEVHRLILGFECILVRVVFELSCFSLADVEPQVTEFNLIARPSQTQQQEEMPAFAYGEADHTTNIQEVCESILYRALMTIALASRASDGSLLRLGKRREAHLVSRVKACLNASASGQTKGHEADAEGLQRITQVLQWIAKSEDA